MAATTTAFIVTVDTEGDNLWARPREITTENSRFAPRFQSLCESHGVRPTWLVNHEMAMCPRFHRFGRDVLRRGAGEIGMHLHAWNSPPLVPLTRDDFACQPYLLEYPDAVMEEKIARLARLLRERFECAITSHRAGRWALDARYAAALVRHGIRVDGSVTPGVDWSDSPGAPDGAGGTDYRDFPRDPYFVDLAHIGRPGDSELLEVPVSVQPSALSRAAPWAYRVRGLRRWAWRHRPERMWLYPDGRNLAAMQDVVREAQGKRRPHLEFVIHSSELMPGGGPSVPDAEHVERLYRDMDAVFAAIRRFATPMTLSEFRGHWVASHATAPRRQAELCPS